MKAVIQRVLSCSVSVNGQVVSSIDRGLCVLIGISKEDTRKDIDYMVQKILKLRFFDNEDGQRWKCNVMDKDFQILCVSQFTLNYSLRGNKLDFHHSMPAETSEPFYYEFLNSLRTNYKTDFIKDGQFGAMMTVNIVNDGPVTIQLDSKVGNKDWEGDDVVDSSTYEAVSSTMA